MPKLWDFEKTHAKAWRIGTTHALEVQLDYWKNSPKFAVTLDRRGSERDHAGVRFAINLFRWEIQIDYYSVFHADHLEQAHRHSSHHRSEILASKQCGCFYCGQIFPPSEIKEWTDEVNDEGQTALCPRCGVDAVIGSKSDYPVSRDYLKQMKKRWF